MYTTRPLFATLSVTLLSALFFSVSCSQQTNEQPGRKQFAKINEDKQTPELADHMRDLQYYTHKLSLAAKAENDELADFYLHEVTAKKDVIKEDIPGYEGYDIAYFMEFMLDPAVDSLTETMKTRNWNKIRSDIESMIKSCNTCHNATAHGFITVTSGMDNNPYNQIFEYKVIH